MSRQANGTYLQPANTAAVSGQTISSTAFNTLITDIATEITNSVDRGGRSAMTAPLPMGGQKITGMADPTVATDGATKNYVDSSAAFTTGDVKLTLKNVADTGWIYVSQQTSANGTIGSAGSGATVRANPDTQPLFNLIFTNLSDANAPLLTSGGAATTRAAQTNAATAWAANCRIQVGFLSGRALGVAGNPPDLISSRFLGDHIGAETVTLAAGNIPTITASNASQAITVGLPTGAARFAYSSNGDLLAYSSAGSGAFVSQYSAGNNWALANGLSANNSISTTYTNASPTAISTYQPTAFLNCMIKL